MKGLKLTSAIVLLSFLIVNPRVNAQQSPQIETKPQTEKFQIESTPKQDLNQDKKKALNYLKQGFSLFKAKNYPQAVFAFNEAIKIQPNNQYAYLGKGISNYMLKQYTLAKTDLDKSIELDSSLSFGYLFRGIANSALGNTKEAVTDLQIAAKQFEQNGETKLAQTSREAIKLIRKG